MRRSRGPEKSRQTWRTLLREMIQRLAALNVPAFPLQSPKSDRFYVSRRQVWGKKEPRKIMSLVSDANQLHSRISDGAGK